MANPQENSESQPLLHASEEPTSRHHHRRSRRPLATLLCICILKRCTHYTDMASVASAPGTASNSSFCQSLLGGVANETWPDLQQTWPSQSLVSTSFLLPVVGGTLADSLFGCVPVLRFACAVYVVRDLVYIVLLKLPNLCELRVTLDAALAVASGFARPCLLALIYEAWLERVGAHPMTLCQLHYFCEVVGQVIGCGIALTTYWLQTDHYNAGLVSSTTCCLATTWSMLYLAWRHVGPERRSWLPDQFERPSRQRIKRAMIVSLPVILMSTATVLGCFSLNGWEVTFFGSLLDSTSLKFSQHEVMFNSYLVLLIYSATLLALLPALALLTWLAQGFLGTGQQWHRIAVGLVLAALGQLSACLLDIVLAGLVSDGVVLDRWALLLMFGLVNCFNAASEAVTFTTMNEVALLIAAMEIRTFVIGAFTALWGSGFLFSVLVQYAGYSAAGNNRSKYFMDALPWTYFVMGFIMAGATVYFIKLAPKALRFLISRQDRSRRAEYIAAREASAPLYELDTGLYS